MTLKRNSEDKILRKILLAELALDGVEVTSRMNGVIDVYNLVIFESSNNMKDTVNGLDVTEECISEPGTLMSSTN